MDNLLPTEREEEDEIKRKKLEIKTLEEKNNEQAEKIKKLIDHRATVKYPTDPNETPDAGELAWIDKEITKQETLNKETKKQVFKLEENLKEYTNLFWKKWKQKTKEKTVYHRSTDNPELPVAHEDELFSQGPKAAEEKENEQDMCVNLVSQDDPELQEGQDMHEEELTFKWHKAIKTKEKTANNPQLSEGHEDGLFDHGHTDVEKKEHTTDDPQLPEGQKDELNFQRHTDVEKKEHKTDDPQLPEGQKDELNFQRHTDVEKKEHKTDDPRLPEGQNDELNFQRFNLGNGISIEGKFPMNFSCKAVPWTPADYRSSFDIPEGCNLETEIFRITDSKTGFPLHEEKTPCSNMVLKVELSESNTESKLYFDYKGALMLQNCWHYIKPISKDNILVFEVTDIESFCVMSTVPAQNYNILVNGGTFTSTVDSRIQVIFPTGIVKKDKMIVFKVHPMNVDCIRQISEEENFGEGLICEVSSGLSADHFKFRKPVMVKLPLQNVPEYSFDVKKYEYRIYKMEDNSSFEFEPEIVPKIENGIASFEIMSFSRYVAGAFSRSKDKKSSAIVLDKAQGTWKHCKILFFVGERDKKYVHIMVECVESHKVKAVVQKRKALGFDFISEWMSKDLFLEPYKTVIAIEIKGKFQISKTSAIKQPKMTFHPMVQDNYEHIKVEIVEKKQNDSSHGVVSFLKQNKLIYEINYDPVRLVKANQSPMPKPKPMIQHQKKTRNQAEFLTDLGILELAKSLDDDSIFQVWLYMNMPWKQYKSDISNNKPFSVESIYEILQTALDQQPDERRVECLISALNKAGKKSLASRVKRLWEAGKTLQSISET